MVLMSAAVGAAASRVFQLAPELSVVTTDFNFAEAKDKLPILIDKYKADPDAVTEQLALLPVRIYEEAEYASHLAKAREYIGSRDPKDVPLLALALKLGIPVWSQDKDFDAAPVERFTTGRLLKGLGQ